MIDNCPFCNALVEEEWCFIHDRNFDCEVCDVTFYTDHDVYITTEFRLHNNLISITSNFEKKTTTLWLQEGDKIIIPFLFDLTPATANQIAQKLLRHVIFS